MFPNTKKYIQISILFSLNGIRVRFFSNFIFPATINHHGGTSTIEQQSIFIVPFSSSRYGAHLKASYMVHDHDDFVECQIQARFYKWNHFHVIETNKLDEYASWKKKIQSYDFFLDR